LQGLSRDEVTLWLYHEHGDSLEVRGTSSHRVGHIARLWLRMQAQYGRCDESMADVAAAVFGLSHTTRDKLRQYVRKLSEEVAV